MRVQDRPTFRAARVRRASPTLRRAAPRRRARSRSPASTRRTAACSTPREAQLTGRRRRRRTRAAARLRVGRSLRSTPWLARALECARDHGGASPTTRPRAPDRRRQRRRRREGAAGAWRNAFLARRTCATRSSPLGVRQRHVRDRDAPGIASPRSTRGVTPRRSTPRDARVRRRQSSRAASRTSIPTARRRTTRSSRAVGTAASSRSGPTIKAAATEALIAPAAPSRTTTRSAATTARGTTASGRRCSPPRCAPPSARSTRAAS